MIAAFPDTRPTGAVLLERIAKAMEIILHIGAHRCATTSFQHYLRSSADRLARDGIGFWGPRRTRTGLFRGVIPGPGVAPRRDPARRAAGRIALSLGRSRAAGVEQLIVSDENIIGSVRENLRLGELYSGIGERVARYVHAFGGRIGAVALTIRSPEWYWASALGYAMTRGRAVPGPLTVHRLATSPRSWRDVVPDVACAAPGARVIVLPFETFARRPDAQLRVLTERRAPSEHARAWLNATPRLPELRALVAETGAGALPTGTGRWQPFDAAQCAALRETYADDMMWLAGGADGLAQLARDPDKPEAGLHPPKTDLTRGRHDEQDRRLAGAG